VDGKVQVIILKVKCHKPGKYRGMKR